MAYIISVSPSHLIARATEPRQTLCNPKLATNPQIYQILGLPHRDLTLASPMWYNTGRLQPASPHPQGEAGR